MTNATDTLMPEILPLGADGLLVRFSTRLGDAANRAVLAFADALDSNRPTGVAEVGTEIFAELRGKRLPVTVAALPFVPNGFKR